MVVSVSTEMSVRLRQCRSYLPTIPTNPKDDRPGSHPNFALGAVCVLGSARKKRLHSYRARNGL